METTHPWIEQKRIVLSNNHSTSRRPCGKHRRVFRVPAFRVWGSSAGPPQHSIPCNSNPNHTVGSYGIRNRHTRGM